MTANLTRPSCVGFLLIHLLVFLQGATSFSVHSVQFKASPHSATDLQPRSTYTTKLHAGPEGDALRAVTGIRPSLHPVTINALSEALKLRAKNLEDLPLRRTEGVEPLQIALAAGRVATEAIHKRQQASKEDGMTLEAKEEQTIAGRVVGVMMRVEDLEEMLIEKCSTVTWIGKYNEWASFGLLGKTENDKEVDDRLKDDPLFCMSRAECLLALFLETVEKPTLEKSGETVPGGSVVDFLDADRKEVLIPE